MYRFAYKFLLACIVCPVVLHGSSSSVQANDVNDLVDSLFVVASSGGLKYRDRVEPAKAELAELGSQAVPRLISKLTTPDARERLTVIRILKSIGEPAVPLLGEALQTLKPAIQLKRICWALGDIGPVAIESSDELIWACGHEDWQVREYALRALGKIQAGAPDDESFNIVSQLFSDSVGQTRKSAVWAAGQFGDVLMVNNLIQALADDYYGARLNAVSALVRIATDSGRALGNAESVISELGEFVSLDQSPAGDLACGALAGIASILPDQAIAIREVLENQLLSDRELRRGAAASALAGFFTEEHSSGAELYALRYLRLTETSIYVISILERILAQ